MFKINDIPICVKPEDFKLSLVIIISQSVFKYKSRQFIIEFLCTSILEIRIRYVKSKMPQFVDTSLILQKPATILISILLLGASYF